MTAPWPRRPLAELSESIEYGLTASATTMPVGPKFLRTTDIQDGTVDWESVPHCGEQEKHEGRYSLSPGDIVFATGKSFLVQAPPEGAVFASYLIRVRPSREVHPPYVARYFQTPDYWRQVQRSSRGSTQAGVNATKLKNLSIPVPPLAEQRRIAAMLDKADAVRRKQREAIGWLDELLRSAFLEMFGDPVTNPKGWVVVRLGEVVDEIVAGWSAKGDDRAPLESEWSVLKISAVTSGRFKPSELKVVGPKPERPVIVPRLGDLLFSRANTRELVAATCLVDQEVPRVFLPDKLWRIVPDRERASPEYLRFLMANPAFRTRITRQATGTSGSMLNVSQSKVRKVPMPLPSLQLQHRFRDLVWRSLHARNRAENAVSEANQLFDSLAQWAFGETESVR